MSNILSFKLESLLKNKSAISLMKSVGRAVNTVTNTFLYFDFNGENNYFISCAHIKVRS